MSAAGRAVLTASLGAVVAVAGLLGPVPVAVVVLVAGLVLALGWPGLLGLPSRFGAAVLTGLAGTVTVVATLLTDSPPYLRHAPVVLAAALFGAFLLQMLRRDGRLRLVETLSATVCGPLVAVTLAGWVATARGQDGEPVVVAGAAALAVATAAAVLPLRRRVTGAAGVALGTLVGAVTGAVLPALGPLGGGVLGLAVGLLVAAVLGLFDRLPSLVRPLPAAAAAVLPVAVTGVLVYVVSRVLVP